MNYFHGRKFIAFFLLCIIIFTGRFCTAESVNNKMTTVMIYMCGSDLETLNYSATKDIEEILHSGLNPDQCNVLIMAGGSKSWGNQYISEKGPGIYQVIRQINDESSLRLRKLSFVGGENMGDSSTLQAFLSYCYDNYASDNQILIFWDHGGGPMEGVCYDETQRMDSLSLFEIKDALENSSLPQNSLSLIGFDSCLMASLETATVCVPYAAYMVASQETEPADGWNYSFLRGITADMSGSDIARQIMEGYIDPEESKLMLTLSCVDLSRLSKITEAMDSFFTAVGSNLTVNNFTMISNDRRDTKSFGRATTISDYDLVDLYHITQQYEEIAETEAREVQAAIKEAVYSVGNQENANGISIYSPYYNKYQFSSKWRTEYDSLDVSHAYSEYMDRFAAIWQGDQLGDWSKLDYQAAPVNKEKDSQTIILELSEEQLRYYSSAKINILQYVGFDEVYRKINEADVTKLEGNTLKYDYDFSMLFAADTFTGRALTYPLSFETIDGYIILTPELESRSRANLSLDLFRDYENNDDFTPGIYATSILRCHKDEDNNVEIDSFSVLGNEQYLLDPKERLLFSRESDSINRDVFNYLNFNNTVINRSLTRDTEGNILPYDLWDISKYSVIPDRYFDQYGTEYSPLNISSNMEVHEFGAIDLRNSWYLAFIKPDEIKRSELYAQFIITDSQGNEITSELIPLNQENTRTFGELNKVIYETTNEYNMNLTINAIKAIRSDYDMELHIPITFTSPQDIDTSLLVTSLEINGQNMKFSCEDINKSKNEKSLIRIFDYVVSEKEFLSSLSSINSIKIEGQINYHEHSWENPFRYDIWGAFEKEIEFSLNLEDIFSEHRLKTFGRASLHEMNFQIKDLLMSDPNTITGSLYLHNYHGRARSVLLKKSERDQPGVIINDIYIPDAWQGPDEIELDPKGEVDIAFKINIPDEYIDRVIPSGFDDIKTISLIAQVTGTFYSYSDDSGYHVVEMGYDKVTFTIENNSIVDDYNVVQLKPIYLGDNVSTYIYGMNLYDGILNLDILLENDNKYLLGTDIFRLHKSQPSINLAMHQPCVNIVVQSVSIDGEEMQIRANSVYTNPDMSEWSSYCSLVGIYPEIYERSTLQIARKDGKDIQNNFSNVSINFMSKIWTEDHYDNTTMGEITITNQKSDKVEWLADELNVSPSVAPLTNIMLTLPDDAEQYDVVLTMKLPQEVISRYEKDEIEEMGVILLSPDTVRIDNADYYMVYSLIEKSDMFITSDYSVRARFPGLLLIPNESKDPIYAMYNLFDHIITVDIASLQIDGIQLGDQYVQYDYSSLEINSDVRDNSSEWKKFNWSVSFTDKTQQPLLKYGKLLMPCDEDSEDIRFDMVESSYMGGRLSLTYIPASDLSPLVMFSFVYTDGTQSSIIVPYDEAADYSVSSLWTCLLCGEESRGISCTHCGELQGNWVCAQCNAHHLITTTTCKRCGTRRLDSWLQHAKENIEAKNYKIAVPILKMLSKHDSMYAVEWLAYIYKTGADGIEKDNVQAEEYIRIGININSAYCYYLMGEIMQEDNNLQDALWYYEVSDYLEYDKARTKIEEICQLLACDIQDEELSFDVSQKIIDPDDEVTVDQDHYLIKTGSTILDFQCPDNYICFTQDKSASLNEYERYPGFYDTMIEFGWHLYVYNTESGHSLQLSIEDEHDIIKWIGDLSTLSNEHLMEFASLYAHKHNEELNEILQSNIPWVRLNQNNLVTIANERLIRAIWFDEELRNNGAGDVNMEEIKLLLGGLSVYSATE